MPLLRLHAAVGCSIVALAVLTACGQGPDSAASTVALASAASPSPSSEPSPSGSTMSDDVRALEQSLHSPGRSISSPVVVKGMFALAPAAADLAVRISAEQALKLAAKQATFGPMQAESPTVEPVIRLALFSQYPPGATGLPEGATTTQRAAWIIALQQVPAGATSHPARFDGSPAPTAPASPQLADVVVTVDATSGKVGGVYLLG